MALLFIVMLAISLGILAIFAAIATIAVKRVWISNNNKKTERKMHKQKNDGKIYSPTGWVWNENTKLWEPPKNLK